MSQKLIQTQTQTQVQTQRLSLQHLLQVKLLEMPIAELEQSVEAELNDNPALEPGEQVDEAHDEEYELGSGNDVNDSDGSDDATDEMDQMEREDRKDELDKALEDFGRDDAMTDVYGPNQYDNEKTEMVYGDTTSFYDVLKEQMGYLELTPKQEKIMDYLICSLDDDGLLRKSNDMISDELAIFEYVDATEKEIEEVTAMLQTFDPAGIGAHSLQECLRIQVERKDDSTLKEEILTVIDNYFDEFTKKHWDVIRQEMKLTDSQTKNINDEILKLNPKPGASLGETEGLSMQQVVPDFIVDTADDGSVSFYITNGDIPELRVSPAYAEALDTYSNNKENMSKRAKEQLLYTKEKVEKAKGFIEAVKMRRHTLYTTMKAIIEWQHKFFVDGDETDLRPMILKDIAEKTKLDKSTISRVCNQKYAQTQWGIFPLRFFFSDSYTTESGEEMSTRKIKYILKEIIDGEDKRKPMSDDALTKAMAEKGYPIARRTIAKYREQMGIAMARLRRDAHGTE